MEVYLNRIDGLDDAILSMFYSKRHMDRTTEMGVRQSLYECVNLYPDGDVPIGGLLPSHVRPHQHDEVDKWLSDLFKWAPVHITMGRFVDLSFTVYNLHRGAQDDLDSHAKRFENRIIRSSTRLATFDPGEMSDWYQGKIIPTDTALAILGITAPEKIEYEGKTYVKSTNGYVLDEMKDNKDVKRGLYMLSIPSCFIFKVNLTEFAHVYKERRIEGTANPELKIAVESMVDQVQENTLGYVTREFLMKVKN